MKMTRKTPSRSPSTITPPTGRATADGSAPFSLPETPCAAYGVTKRKPDTASLLADDRVVRAITTILGRFGTRFQDLRDGVA